MLSIRRNLAVSLDPNSGVPALNVDLVGPRHLPVGIALGTPGYNNALQLVGRGGVSPYAFAIVSGALPTGCSLNVLTGAITGTPSVQGSYPLVVSITDNVSTVVPHSFSFDVFGNLYPLNGHVSPFPGVRGQPYNYQVLFADAAGSTAGISYAISAGALPAGITLTSSGLLTAPTITGTAGTFSFTVRGTKSGATVDVPMAITIRPALTIVTASITLGSKAKNAVVGVPVDDYVTLSGPNPPYGLPPYTWSIAAGALPPGLSMDSSGHITGTPTAATAKTYAQPTFQVMDSMGVVRTLTPTSATGVNVNSSLKAATRGNFIVGASDGTPIEANLLAAFLGDGSDGDFICNGSNTCPGTTLSFGVNIAQRDLFLNTLTSAAGGKLNMQGFVLYILDTQTGWDVTNAPVGAVIANGGSASGSTADATPTGNPLFSVRGRSGVAGTTGAGVTGVSMPTILTLGGGYGGGATGNAGKGGAGTAGASGAAGSKVNWSYNDLGSWPVWSNFTRQYPDPAAGAIVSDAVWAGAGGASGSPGAGSGAAAGGASGAGGNGGGRLVIRAGAITTSSSTPAGVVQCQGGQGGNGVAGGGTGRGGGGGGFGGGGGYLFVYYGQLNGPAVANFAWADGGQGGDGGAAGGGAGTAGVGGQGGIGGRVYLENMLAASSVSVSGILGSVPAIPTTTAGGAGTQAHATLP